MKIITVTFKAKPQFRNETLDLCKGMLEPSRNEAGCISYTLYQDATDENAFFFFEEWNDQHAIDEHVKSKHYQAFVPKFKTLIDGEETLIIRTVV